MSIKVKSEATWIFIINCLWYDRESNKFKYIFKTLKNTINNTFLVKEIEDLKMVKKYCLLGKIIGLNYSK